MSFGLELVNFYRGISPSLVFRCHWDRAAIESRILLRLKAPLFAARLKLCREKRRAATWGRPYGGFGSGPFFFVGAGHWPARREGSAIPKPTLIRLACARHLPPCRGKACGRPKVAPSKYGKLSGRSVGADDLGDPRAHTVRPYSGKRGGSVGSANLGAEVKPHQPQF